MLICRFGPSDRERVLDVHAEAFRRPDTGADDPPEVGLLVELLDDGDVIERLCLVAFDDGRPIGHVACSTAGVGAHSVAALGPIAVLPSYQRAGVGHALMHAVLAAADAIDVPLVGLLGSTAYYPRFGFVPATTLGIAPPDAGWGDHFQVRALHAYHAGITGRFATRGRSPVSARFERPPAGLGSARWPDTRSAISEPTSTTRQSGSACHRTSSSGWHEEP